MSEEGALLIHVTQRLLAERFDVSVLDTARAGAWLEDRWGLLAEQGLPLGLVQGEQGFGIPLTSGLELVRLLGRYVVPLPLAETMIANALLAQAGLPVVEAPLALVPECSGIELQEREARWRAVGEAERVAWGRNAAALVVEYEGRIALVRTGFRSVETGGNLADMPRDRIIVDGPAIVAPALGLSLLEAGALVRAITMAGAMEVLVELTVGHVTQREQFGRALSGFQAVQHSLARLAGEAAAASAAAGLAADAFAHGSKEAATAIATARARISDAAGVAIGLAHQLHGAMGFTEEHRLHRFTSALWSWRDEFGNAAWWTRRLGAQALAQSKQAYWPFVTAV